MRFGKPKSEKGTHQLKTLNGISLALRIRHGSLPSLTEPALGASSLLVASCLYSHVRLAHHSMTYNPALLDQWQFPDVDLVLFLPESLHVLCLFWESSCQYTSCLANLSSALRSLQLRDVIHGPTATASEMQNRRP